MSSSSIRLARDEYHRALSEAALDRTRTIVATARADPGLTSAGHGIDRILRPCFISAAQHAAAQQSAVAVVAALESLYRAARGSAELRRKLGVATWQDQLIGVEPADAPPAVGRLDGFLGRDDQLRMIEFNPAPGGTYEVHALSRLFAATPAMDALSRYAPHWPDPLEAAYQMLLANYARADRPTSVNVAVLGWSQAPNIGEIQRLAAHLTQRGMTIKPVQADDAWVLDSGGLSLDAFRVDLLLFLDPMQLGDFLSRFGPAHPVFRAVREGHSSFFGGLFRTLFLASKRVFAALSEPTFRALIPPELHAELHKCIPWTRIVQEGRTTHASGEVDLLEFAAKHRTQLVLKPALASGGKGVVLGWRTSVDEWEQALVQSLADGGVVQERVDAPQDSFPLWEDGKLVFRELFWDLNPFVWRGRTAEGYLVRVGSDPLLNTSAGLGSSTALFVLG
ncbi:MAG TPA: hypothetical protein VFQ61_19700 [Polyangiaceae bacterium]|nr:hypothetical protein [Polyangiaceae bacterium]